jgi:hypothetical protein
MIAERGRRFSPEAGHRSRKRAGSIFYLAGAMWCSSTAKTARAASSESIGLMSSAPDCDGRQKFFPVAQPLGLSGWVMPLIVVEAAHQNRQPGTELGHLVGGELKRPTSMRRRKIQPVRSRNFW